MKKIAIFTMAVLLLFAASAQADLVGLWHLDGDATDSSGNGNNGTLYGDATYTMDGVFGQALSLDGNGDYVDCGSDTSLDITGDLTIEAWVRFDTFTGRPHSYIAAKDGVGQRSYGLAVNGDYIASDYPGAGVVGFIVFNPLSIHWGSTILDTDQWYHIAATCDYLGDGTSVLRIYVDGVEDSSSQTTGVVSPINVGSANLQIGAREYTTSRCFVDGNIDEVRIWDEVLSPWPGPPTYLTVYPSNGDICFDWDGVLGAVKYSVDVEGTVNFDYFDVDLGDAGEWVYSATLEVEVSFGTSDRTDGGDMLDSYLCIDPDDFYAALGAAICEELEIDPDDLKLLLKSFTNAEAKVKALSPGPKGKGGPQNNPFSDPPTPFPDL